ncbi:MAG: hypothetical protein RH982_04820 [Parvibaculum sp.]
MAGKEAENPQEEAETAKRRDEALRRALKMPPDPQKGSNTGRESGIAVNKLDGSCGI